MKLNIVLRFNYRDKLKRSQYLIFLTNVKKRLRKVSLYGTLYCKVIFHKWFTNHLALKGDVNVISK